MDNLVLTTVTRVLDHGLRGALLEDLRQETPHRFRLRWNTDGRSRSTAISMRPDGPWIGRPCVRAGKTSHPGKFAGLLRRSLVGARLARVVKPSSDRRIELVFLDERRLIIELAVHRCNLVLVDATGSVLSSLRRPRSAPERLEPGKPYGVPPAPEHLLDPFVHPAARTDDLLEQIDAAPVEGLRRHLFGIGKPGATLVCEESSSMGDSYGEVLERRLAELEAGRLDPVIELPQDSDRPPGFDPSRSMLWPWQPDRQPLEGLAWLRGADAGETAGWWYETRDAHRHGATRQRALAQIIRHEAARTRLAMRKCEADLRGFEDPQKFRRWAEALLAGLTRARRVGAGIVVPDPLDPDAGDLVVPVAPGVPPAEAARKLFLKHRRAIRGHERARARLDSLVQHDRALTELERGEVGPDWTEAQQIAEMRRLRLPVALEPDTRAGRAASAGGAPRMEGVRVYHASTGEMILAGKGGRENHRLTFKLAAPHDFWLHALGTSGAHVILRNETRASRPGNALAQAAAVAAHHSQASSQPFADVQWTQRKNVRKPRGAKPGTVIIKRFETIRVRPGLP